MNKLAKVFQDARSAANCSGRPILSILVEAMRMRIADQKLGITEYFDLGLYQNDLTRDQKKKFAGWRFGTYCQDNIHINHPWWRVVEEDKLLFHSYAHAVGIPMPKLLAVYSPRHRSVQSDVIFVDTPDGLHQLLRECREPLFVKPISSNYGRGARRILPRDDNTEIVRDSKSGEQPTGEFVKNLVAAATEDGYRGFLFQRVLEPHADLRKLAGPMLSGIRIGILNSTSRAEIYRAVLKINRGDSVTDNFEHGMSGNLLGDIDIKTGTVGQVIAGSGLSLRTVETHPTTNTPLSGFEVPYWPEVYTLVQKVGLSLPRLRVIGVDVVVTPEGPVVLEVNLPGDFDLLQIACRRGVLEEPGLAEILNAARQRRWERARNATELFLRALRY